MVTENAPNSFAYQSTNCHIRYTWKNGRWSQAELSAEPYIKLHIAATCLHYGQSGFEGLKAFHCKDGKVRIFRANENAKRLNHTASRLLMPDISEELFLEAVHRVVKENIEHVPSYESKGSLYIRPLLFGSGPRIGVQPADEYTFIVLVTPVGDYYQNASATVDAVILEKTDSVAPFGLGDIKAAANYAGSMEVMQRIKDQGFAINLYLDAKEQRYVEEFGTANFIAIDQSGNYLTPDSNTILPSITNQTLMSLAKDDGIEVIKRPIEYSEVNQFTEVGACGTAVVITPVNRIVKGEHVIEIRKEPGLGPVLSKLFNRVRGIQRGDLEDKFGWTSEV